jgi:uncharacterized protein YlxW (UPF0749 family)
MYVYWAFLIPIVAILAGAFKEWLSFRAQQEKLGTSTEELVKAVTSLQEERRDLVRRLENLETIVTSRLWETVRGSTVTPADLARLDIELSEIPEELPPTMKAESLAQTLGV